MLIPSVSGDIQKSRAERTRCTPWFRLHLVMQSTDTNRACAASTRFYQVTSLVTNPTIVAALLHILMPKKAAHVCILIETVLEKPAVEAERVKPRSRSWHADTTRVVCNNIPSNARLG